MAKLLIVDDDRNIRLSLVKFFHSLGHQVSEAENGARARTMLTKSRFDLLLTDLRMAETNGLELVKVGRWIHPEIGVILMTAFATVESAVAAMKAGAYDYVTKPFSLDEIQHAVDRALEVKELRTEVRALRNSKIGR